MRVGIDLDNTILCYDKAFLMAASQVGQVLPENLATKSQIRKFIRSQQDGELLWQRLQGLAYGVCTVEYAELFPGVQRFLWRCLNRAYDVFVVSHKTEYGHFDSSRISLRESAKACLRNNGLLDTNNSLLPCIFFESTRPEKVARIEALNLDVFIDDLHEVFEDLEQSRCSEVRKILFSPGSDEMREDLNQVCTNLTVCSNWQSIDSVINGAWVHSELESAVRIFNISSPIQDIRSIKRGGNAGVYNITLSNEHQDNCNEMRQAFKLKIYPIDAKHNRLRSEFEGILNLKKQGIRCLPQPIASNPDLGIGLFEWLPEATGQQTKFDPIDQCLQFITQLQQQSRTDLWHNFPSASAACFSGSAIVEQLHTRQQQFEAARILNPALDHFLSCDFHPLFADILTWSERNWPKSGAGFNEDIPRSQQTLSPSDFGLHNSIQTPKNTLVFIDFEYFGWDDPAKLVSDFFFHPGMSLTDEQRRQWVLGCLDIYGHQLIPRLQAALPLFGLIWCLIILNDYRDEVWERRMLADDSQKLNRVEVLTSKLRQSKRLLGHLRSDYATFISNYVCS
ncbi:MAG: phosphotransferase [Spirulina sp. SIO3F2]|nr:phosphotransferase [Spirulina sp. SIO3F2]